MLMPNMNNAMEVDQNGNKESSSLQNTPTKVMPKKQRGDAGLEISSASSSGNLGCQVWFTKWTIEQHLKLDYWEQINDRDSV